MAKHYIDNKTLLNTLIQYKKEVKASKKKGLPRPRIPNYIGECFFMIANRLSTKPNFINYTYRDDMVSDGIENCIVYIDNFDPEKSSNPFAYFTQIIYFAFLRRIYKEKKQLYIKHKSLENSSIFDEIVEHGDEHHIMAEADSLSNTKMQDIVRLFEEGLETKRNKRKITKLEKVL